MAEHRHLQFGAKTALMGILNATPDSFSGDGLYRDVGAIVARAEQMVEEGADLLDIGGESTRPGAEPVDEAEELARVLPAIRLLASRVPVPLSVDTSKASVAEQALDAGASIVNDVSGLRDPELPRVAARYGATLVLVDAERHPASEVIEAVIENLQRRIDFAMSGGVQRNRLVVDPGFGFGKGWRENFAIVRDLSKLQGLQCPILVGPSRKGMIGRVLGDDPERRIEGTAALVSLCIANGAHMVRVHDVREMKRVAQVMDAIRRPDE